MYTSRSRAGMERRDAAQSVQGRRGVYVLGFGF